MDKQTQQHLIGIVVVCIGLAHQVWPSQLAEINRRRALVIYPSTSTGVRILGAFLLLFGLLAVLT
jgi:uncharacterized membrane protein